MNEHDLQRALTKQWTECGVFIQGTKHLLVAWEVMVESWRINDAAKHWGEVSVDFLVADEQRRLTIIELKTATGIATPKKGWLALCQVTQQAATLSKSFAPARIEGAFKACWSGEHTRVAVSDAFTSLSNHHRSFFGSEACSFDASPAIRRCIAAPAFSPSWPKILADFNALSGAAVKTRFNEELTSKEARKRILRRFNELEPEYGQRIAGPVISMTVPCHQTSPGVE